MKKYMLSMMLGLFIPLSVWAAPPIGFQPGPLPYTYRVETNHERQQRHMARQWRRQERRREWRRYERPMWRDKYQDEREWRVAPYRDRR